MLRLTLGLMLDYEWDDLSGLLMGAIGPDGTLAAPDVAAFAVESFASIHPETGPLLNRLVSAAGGAALTAVRDLSFWADLGTPRTLGETLIAFMIAPIEHDLYNQRFCIRSCAPMWPRTR